MGTESPIIPTPAYAEYGADLPLTGADRHLQVALSPDPGVTEQIALQTLRAAVTRLGGSVTAVSEQRAATVRLALLSAGGADAELDAEDLATFEQPNGAEQGYVIRSAAAASRHLYLAARDAQGLLYAAVTLAQLLRLEDGRIVARGAHVRDWPSFRYRGNNWLLWVECGRWSYERGDGAAAYAERIERKLDFSLQHKINLLIFDGFGWNPERFPGYGALLRRCTRYARERGIKLLVGGYGAGYGAGDRYDGHIFRNRHGYPDGELYDCYRFVGRDRSSTFGTCLSNDGLTALKQEELSRFVPRDRARRPLYSLPGHRGPGRPPALLVHALPGMPATLAQRRAGGGGRRRGRLCPSLRRPVRGRIQRQQPGYRLRRRPRLHSDPDQPGVHCAHRFGHDLAGRAALLGRGQPVDAQRRQRAVRVARAVSE